MRDFYHSPFDGIGLQVATQASNVYLQLAATGGLIMITSMAIYLLGAGLASHRLIAYSTLAAPLLSSIIAVLALNYFEADLTDRFYYVPEALIVAVMCAANQDSRSPGERAPLAALVPAGGGAGSRREPVAGPRLQRWLPD